MQNCTKNELHKFSTMARFIQFRYVVIRLNLICRCANLYSLYLCSTVLYYCS